MRLIDADAVIDRINIVFLTEIGKIIDDAPTIDAVKIVRCKDCRYVDKSDQAVGDDTSCFCEWFGSYMKMNGYCSEGEVNKQ